MGSRAPSSQRLISVQRPWRVAGAPTPAIREHVILDMQALVQSRANALIIGHPFAVRHILASFLPSLEKSVLWAEGARLSLPVGYSGTLILEDSDRLNERDQAVLLGWLNDRGRSVRVLTTASRPLFPAVEAGSFLGQLYYRLNHVLIAVD